MKATRPQGVPTPLKIVIVTINCLLVLQYLLGMIVNLFDTLPFATIDLKRGSFLEKTGMGFAYARTSPILSLQLHWLNASLLIVASIVLIILGAKARNKVVWLLALLLSLIFSVATVSGASFIAYEGNNYYSFSMATAFIVASIFAVFLLLYAFVSGQRQRPQGPQPRDEEIAPGRAANR